MSLNLIDAAKALFTGDLVRTASSQLGESESGVNKAINGIIPTVFGGLLSKVSSTDGSNAVAQMVREHTDAGLPANMTNLFSPGNSDLLNRGTGLLGGLFGAKSNIISDLISNFAGVKSSTAGSLLSMAVPALLGLLGRHSSSTEPHAISSLLNSQKDNITSAIPPGLNLSNVLGNMGFGGSKVVTEPHAAAHYVNEPVKSNSPMRFLLPLLLLLAAAIAAYYFFGKKSDKSTELVTTSTDTTTTPVVAADNSNVVSTTTGKYDSLTNDFVYDPGKMVMINLPNSAGKLEVGENSTENKLYKFLSDPNSVIDTAKGNWFEFTNVKFKTGSSEITNESTTQLKNIVAISKGFPTAQFKLGGYTDNTGNASSNTALSQRRAEAVAAMLKKLGAAAASIGGAKGYGPEWPVADNATPEGRAQNRRVAINVKSK